MVLVLLPVFGYHMLGQTRNRFPGTPPISSVCLTVEVYYLLCSNGRGGLERVLGRAGIFSRYSVCLMYYSNDLLSLYVVYVNGGCFVAVRLNIQKAIDIIDPFFSESVGTL